MKKQFRAVMLVVLAMVLVFSFVACGHQHTFNNEWTTNETHHWQTASCDHEEKRYEGEHQFGVGSENADGTEMRYTCRI